MTSLNDLQGQPHALKFLRGVLNSKRYPKAMVFHGAPGVGKGFAARLFALEACKTGDVQRDALAEKMFEVGDHPELNFYRPEDCYSEAELSKRKTDPTWKVSKVREFLTVLKEPVIHGARRTVVFEDFEKIPFGQAAIPDAFLKILEDGVDHTTVILTTTNLDALPGTLRARLTDVRFARLPIPVVKSFLPSHASDEHFELSCSLGRGSLDETLSFLVPEEGGLSGYDLRKRALTLLRLLHASSGGKILSFLSTLSEEDALKFFVTVRSIYSDLLLVESGVTQGLYHGDCYDELAEIVTEFDGNLAAGVPALRMLLDRMDRPGIRFPHQMKAAFLDLKIRTNPSKV